MRAALEMAASTSVQTMAVTRHLRLIWQDEVTRGFVQVGALWELAGGAFAFEYTPHAHHERFVALPEFPRLEDLYVTDRLPAFFANRAMSSNRRSYATYCAWLGLDDIPSPVEILARSGGGRSTDTFHIVEGFAPVNGRINGSFFASGVRHIDGAHNRIQQLAPGHPLAVRREVDNPVNHLALLLDSSPGKPVGYIPDWLVGDLNRLDLGNISVKAERLNPQAPPHLQLMCRLVASI